jgi:hypothetical protein
MKVIVFYMFIFQSLLLTAYSAENYFVTQTGAGLHNGTSIENAFSASEFNNNANWGIGTGKISGGDTVYLNGSITSSLTLQGSGSSGNVITIDGSNATMSAQINAQYRSYYKLQYLTWSNYGSENFLSLGASSYGTIDHITFLNVPRTGINIGRQGSTQTHHLTFSNLNLVTTSDYLGNVERDIIVGCANDVTLEKSYIEMKWQGCGACEAHNDFWQTWGTQFDSSCQNPTNMVARYNKFVSNINATTTVHSYFMWASLTGNNYVYGNIFHHKGSIGDSNSLVFQNCVGTSNVYVYNNTIVDNGSQPEYYDIFSPNNSSGTTIHFRNNIIYNPSASPSTQIIAITSGSLDHQYNMYYGGGGSSYLGKTCASYMSTGEICNSDPLFTDYKNNEFSLQTGSEGNGSGINLDSDFLQQIKPGSTWPNPTLITSATMNIGAYGNDTLSIKKPGAPTMLTIE